MTIEPGRALHQYRLVEKIGEGGMGVVWKAVDSSLGREAAIKILPDAFAQDAERRARFEREARLLATLHHPGIAGIYGLYECDGLHFIAMEYVPGEDLARRLERGPLALGDALDVARQIAEALEAAHEQGVIHRDLKPANITRMPDGTIKVLDLGLAKALSSEGSADRGRLSLSPTVTSAGTTAGTLLGTAAYMSPEQVKGHEADRRADIWAFGCVLQEMLTGRRTFGGETMSETLASVLRDEVAQDNLPEGTPDSVRRLLRRCLDRDRRTRLRDIGEARIALSPQGLAASTARTEVNPAVAIPGARGGGLAWGVAGVALVALAVTGWIALRRSGAAAGPEVRTMIAPPVEQSFLVTGFNAGALSLSPDGTRATFVASTPSGRPSLYLRNLGSTTPQIIPGSENATFPFWSPDSRQLAFFADGKLKKISLDGGAPMTIASAPEPRGGTWGANGTILFAADTQAAISSVSAGGVLGGPATTVDPSRGGETTHRYPWFLPDGRHFLYLRASHSAAAQDAVNSIWIGDVESKETSELMQSGTNAAYARGHVFWAREGFLMARAFSLDTLSFTGEPFVVGEGVVTQPDSWRATFAVSVAGPIAFQTGLAPKGILTWLDREGKELGTLGDPGKFGFIRLSPEGRSLAAAVSDPTSGRGDIWVFDLQRGVGGRLTFDSAAEDSPVWSPDGKRIAFSSNLKGKTTILVRPSNGRGGVERMLPETVTDRAVPDDWSSDGKFLAFSAGAPKFDQWVLPLEGGEAFPLVVGDFDEGYGRFSPDGTWMAYISNESGRYELYLTRFPSGEGKWQLTKIGADWLVGWNAAGNAVYYLDLESRLCEVHVDLADQVVADQPICLFPTRSGRTWAARSDGQRFLIGIPDDAGSDFPITLVLNWEAGRAQ
jgi:Tol biopolymer transport system component